MAEAVTTLFTALDSAMGPGKSQEFKTKIGEYSSTLAKAQASLSSASASKRAREIFDTTDNPQVVEIRNRREALRKELEQVNLLAKEAITQIESQVGDSLTDEQKKALRKERNEARNHLVALLDGVQTLADMFFQDEALKSANEAAREEFLGKKRQGTGATGTPKARVAEVHAVQKREDGTTGQDVTEKTFSAVALRTKMDAGLLLSEWLKAAGTNDWKTIENPVTYTVGEFEVTVKPREKKAEQKAEVQPDAGSNSESPAA